MFQITTYFFLTVFILSVLSCGKSNTSRGTGWAINSKDGGFQYNTDFEEQETGPGLVFIEGGTFTKGQVQDDVMHDWNNSPNQQHVMSFYIDETEVTNIMYMEYLDWLETVFPKNDENYKKVYMGALPDTLVWRNTLGYVEELTTNYLRHPAYAEYPVVGVTWKQANYKPITSIDGEYKLVIFKSIHFEASGKINDTILNILGGVRSSCTYVGAPSLKQLSKCTTFVRVSSQFNDSLIK